MLQLVVRFFHGLGGSLRFGVLVHVVIHGERADRHQDHQHRHHDGADEGLLLALLLHLFGASFISAASAALRSARLARFCASLLFWAIHIPFDVHITMLCTIVVWARYC